MPYHCECQQCINNEFDPEDYIIKKENFKILDKERPLGISGHLRVKDEAMSVAECIDSCIDALDELIITYNKSSDNTEEILKEYEKKYPDKIRLYFYEPNMIKYAENEYKVKYSEIHYLDNYYNFGYLKIKYKYYMKIYADQIYFTENFRTYYVKKLFNIKDKDYKFNGVEELLNLKDFIIYSRIKHGDDYCLMFGGFDLVLNNNSFYLNTSNVYNSCYGDHFIIIPNRKYIYNLCKSSGLEILDPPNNHCIAGLAWVHLGSVKRGYNVNSGIEVRDIAKMSIKDILQYIEGKDYRDIKKDFTIKYFDNDKKYINDEFYDRYLKKPLEYAIEHYKDEIKRLW